jgi:hypothetical protein
MPVRTDASADAPRRSVVGTAFTGRYAGIVPERRIALRGCVAARSGGLVLALGAVWMFCLKSMDPETAQYDPESRKLIHCQ